MNCIQNDILVGDIVILYKKHSLDWPTKGNVLSIMGPVYDLLLETGETVLVTKNDISKIKGHSRRYKENGNKRHSIDPDDLWWNK